MRLWTTYWSFKNGSFSFSLYNNEYILDYKRALKGKYNLTFLLIYDIIYIENRNGEWLNGETELSRELT